MKGIKMKMPKIFRDLNLGLRLHPASISFDSQSFLERACFSMDFFIAKEVSNCIFMAHSI
ncbi:MAG: hypothetical protein HYZ85_02820 [Candidatus Omnitrophica bacterium]|nr:hypothetical protein [Candidatus Omnitrophota bacterium]